MSDNNKKVVAKTRPGPTFFGPKKYYGPCIGIETVIKTIPEKINHEILKFLKTNFFNKRRFSNFFDRYIIIAKYQIGPGLNHSAGLGR
jgi:hypothetical protein